MIENAHTPDRHARLYAQLAKGRQRAAQALAVAAPVAVARVIQTLHVGAADVGGRHPLDARVERIALLHRPHHLARRLRPRLPLPAPQARVVLHDERAARLARLTQLPRLDKVRHIRLQDAARTHHVIALVVVVVAAHALHEALPLRMHHYLQPE